MTYNVIQIGSQREVLVGTVSAASEEEAQDMACQEFGDPDNKDADYSSFRVQAVAGTQLSKEAIARLDATEED